MADGRRRGAPPTTRCISEPRWTAPSMGCATATACRSSRAAATASTRVLMSLRKSTTSSPRRAASAKLKATSASGACCAPRRRSAAARSWRRSSTAAAGRRSCGDDTRGRLDGVERGESVGITHACTARWSSSRALRRPCGPAGRRAASTTTCWGWGVPGAVGRERGTRRKPPPPGLY